MFAWLARKLLVVKLRILLRHFVDVMEQSEGKVKKFLVLLSFTLLLAVNAVNAFAGDVEKALFHDLSECGRIVKQIAVNTNSGRPTADDIARLRKSAEDIHADRLLLGERYTTLTGRTVTLGGKAADRQDAVSSTLLNKLDELLTRLDAIETTITPSDLENLKEILDKLVPHKSRPLLGSLPYKHTNYPPREPAATPVVKPAYKGGDRAVYAADTVTTPEAPISKEIVDLAQSLQWNPVLIYEWVKNNVDTEWYWGSMKGAEETLRQKSGNDADQATLLVALLRAANFPARYIKGTIDFFPDIERAKNLTGLDDPAKVYTFLQKAGIPVKPVIAGGGIANFQIEHVWVETFIPYSNYRGAVVDDQGKIWLGLDTSIKPQGYTRTPGAGVPADILAPLRDDYLKAEQPLSPLDYLKGKLIDSLATTQPPKTWSDLKDSAVLIPEVLKIIPSSLQFNQIAISGEYQTLPDELKHKVAFTATAGGNELFAITLDAQKLSSRKVSLRAEPETVEDQNTIDSFGGVDNTPPYLVRLRPVLTVDGERMIVAQDGLPMGGDYSLNIDIITPNGTERISSSQINGNLSVISVVAQKAQTPAAISEGDNAEAILYKEAIGYIDRWNKAEDDLAALLGQSVSRPTVSIATVGAQLEVTQLLDIPNDMQWKGVYLDAGYRRIESVGRNGNERDFMRLSALQGSILENRIFEDDLKVDSISTAKLLQQAVTGGTITVSIDKTNIDTILPQLPFDDAVNADIANAVNQGMTVTIPQNEVGYLDWTGIGYVKEDPQTGESGWMLSGQVAGGMTAVAKAQWIQQDLADLLTKPYTAKPDKDIAKASRALRLRSADYQKGIAGKTLATPLIAQVVDNANRPVQGILVTFRVIVGGGSLEGLSSAGKTITQSGSLVTVSTGSDGLARARLTMGQFTSDAPLYINGTPNSIQIGQNLVAFSADTGQGTIQGDNPFESFGYPGDAVSVVRVAENKTDNQIGDMGTFSGTVWARVADEYGNPVSNKSVTFSLGAVQYLGMTPSPDSATLPAKLIPSAAACPGVPTLDCSATKDTITVVSDYNGATTGVILGTVENAAYSIIAQSTSDLKGKDTGNPISISFTHKTTTLPRIGDAMVTPYLRAVTLYHFDDRGNQIDVGAAGQPFGYPLVTELLYFEEAHKVAIKPNCSFGCYYLKGTGVVNQTKATNGSVTFSAQMGGGTVNPTAVTNTDSAIYSTALTLGTLPSLNVVNAAGTYQTDIPTISSVTGIESRISTTLEATTSFSIWGIGLSLDTSNPVFITANGYPEADTYFPFQINPRAYTTRFVDMRIFEDQSYLGSVTINPGGQLVLSQGGAKFDLTKRYTADVVLNWGSGIEVRSITVPLDVTALALIPDYDHNRKIDQSDRQRALNRDKYYFWVNDDDGTGDTEGTGIPGTRDPATIGVVSGTRDLVDYFPINLDLKNMFNAFDPASYTYTLKHEDGSLDFVIAGLNPKSSGDYLTTSLAQTLANAATIPITSTGYVLSQALIDNIKAGNGTIIVESWKQTQKPLVLEVSKGGALVKSTRLNLSIDGVEQMFRHKNLMKQMYQIEQTFPGIIPPGGVLPVAGHPVPNEGKPDRLTASDFSKPDHFTGFDADNDGKDFVHVHGYNVNGQDARGEQSEVFKRLYWSGSRARFWGVTWYGYDSQDDTMAVILRPIISKRSGNYHVNVRHAFNAGKLLEIFVDDKGLGNATFSAHSLGNMVLSTAIRKGMPYYRYLMANPAVAEEAYTPESTYAYGDNWNNNTRPLMYHPLWRYPTGTDTDVGYSPFLWASEWYKQFSPSDDRSKLTWRNYFSKVREDQKTFVFFAPTDEAFRPFNYDATAPGASQTVMNYPTNSNNVPGFEDVVENFSFNDPAKIGTYSWVLQELFKGRVDVLVKESFFGGWGFNFDNYFNFVNENKIQDANNLPYNVLSTAPFFKKNPENGPLYSDMPVTLTEAKIEELLANEIPALTFSAGHRGIGIFENMGIKRNFDIRDRYLVQLKAPWVLRETTGRQDYIWKHSDYVNIAYPYLYRLYDDWVSVMKGNELQ